MEFISWLSSWFAHFRHVKPNSARVPILQALPLALRSIRMSATGKAKGRNRTALKFKPRPMADFHPLVELQNKCKLLVSK
jgi:hypothetical protein